MRATVLASSAGFQPEVVEFIQGRPAIVDFRRVDDTSCVNAVRMPWMSQALPLPLNETVSVRIPDTSQAGEFGYACWMNMIRGKVVIRPRSRSGN